MDPLTQGLIGAAAAQAVAGRRIPRAWLLGMIAGMAPDLDVLIRSEADPLLAVEYHRHFTHALAFIPFGASFCAGLFLLLRCYREQWRITLLAATAAFATHGLLDASTSYGTQLLWPFSDLRVAWNWISILDPIYTLLLLLGVIIAALQRNRWPVLLAIVLSTAYIGIGAMQRSKAIDAQHQIAAERGHRIERGEVYPSIGNHLVWRSLYRADGILYADRIRVTWNGPVQWTAGTSVPHLTTASLSTSECSDPRVVDDFNRFYWFSDSWVAPAPDDPGLYGDVRYSLQTHAFEPIWGIRFHPNTEHPTEWISRTRDRQLALANLWAEIRGTASDYQILNRPFPP